MWHRIAEPLASTQVERMTTIVESTPSIADMFVGASRRRGRSRHEHRRAPSPPRRTPGTSSPSSLGPGVNLQAALAFAEALRISHPALSVILVRPRVGTGVLTDALRSGLREVVEERDLTGLSLAVHRAHALFKALTARPLPATRQRTWTRW